MTAKADPWSVARALHDDGYADDLDLAVAWHMVELCDPVPDHPGVMAFVTRDDAEVFELSGVYVLPEYVGKGALTRYLDSLPTDRKVVVPMVISKKLGEALERRGFRRVAHFEPKINQWTEAHYRHPLHVPEKKRVT